MKEIETLVEEKTKESLDVSRLTREGEPAAGDTPAHIHQVAAPTRLCSAHHVPASACVAGAKTSSTFSTPGSCHPDSPRQAFD